MSGTEENITYESLLELTGSIKDQFIGPYKNNQEALRSIKSQTKLQESDPLTEVGKLAKILKAYSTKLGIICDPKKLHDNYDAAFKELRNYSDSLFYLLSLLPLFIKEEGEEYAEFLVDNILTQVSSLLNGTEVLCDEIENKGNENKENRLMSIGMIWAACDAMEAIVKGGNVGILTKKISLSCGLVDDVLNDINEWLEDPQLDDMTLMENDTDSLEELQEGIDKLSFGEEEERAIERIKDFLTEWQTKIKMIKLLLTSFSKSISMKSNTPIKHVGAKLDQLNKLHQIVVQNLDELISDVFMSGATFEVEEMEESITDLNATLKSMVKIIKEISKQDPKKSKWIDVWQNKFFEEN
ncbi:Uncharacterized protein RNJ44_03149 [Nakaseomyces bracarensis]|uniref:Uncharacterized protein n=1 Tax=Nakaseomyces bracarensis TaxID=273131 RepID=A0ABR4NYY7_9SACH